MRVVVFIFSLVFASFQLCAEENGSSVVQPISEESTAVHAAKDKEKHQDNADVENYIRFTVREFERLIKAIVGQEKEPDNKGGNKGVKCDDPKLRYAEFLGCKDLEAQIEMADGTTSISKYTRWAFFFVSIPALILLTGSFIAAKAAATHAKKSAIAAAEMIDVAKDENRPFFEIFGDVTASATLLKMPIKNIGKTAARDIKVSYRMESTYPNQILKFRGGHFTEPVKYDEGHLPANMKAENTGIKLVPPPPDSYWLLINFTCIDFNEKTWSQTFVFRGYPSRGLPPGGMVSLTRMHNFIIEGDATSAIKDKEVKEINEGNFTKIGRKIDSLFYWLANRAKVLLRPFN